MSLCKIHDKPDMKGTVSKALTGVSDIGLVRENIFPSLSWPKICILVICYIKQSSTTKPYMIKNFNVFPVLSSSFFVGSGGDRVVKLLACGSRGPGFDSPPRHLNFRNCLSPASKSRYGWNTAKATQILNTTNQPTNQPLVFLLRLCVTLAIQEYVFVLWLAYLVNELDAGHIPAAGV